MGPESTWRHQRYLHAFNSTQKWTAQLKRETEVQIFHKMGGQGSYRPYSYPSSKSKNASVESWGLMFSFEHARS